MQTDIDRQYEDALRNVEKNSEAYWALRFKYDMIKMGKAREHNYKANIVNNIIRMNRDIKKLQVSTFTGMRTEQLLEMGAAMTVMYDILKKHGMIERLNNEVPNKQNRD